MISYSGFSNIKGDNPVIYISHKDSNLHVSHCDFKECEKYTIFSYKNENRGGACMLHIGNNISCEYISLCACSVSYTHLTLPTTERV